MNNKNQANKKFSILHHARKGLSNNPLQDDTDESNFNGMTFLKIAEPNPIKAKTILFYNKGRVTSQFIRSFIKKHDGLKNVVNFSRKRINRIYSTLFFPIFVRIKCANQHVNQYVILKQNSLLNEKNTFLIKEKEIVKYTAPAVFPFKKANKLDYNQCEYFPEIYISKHANSAVCGGSNISLINQEAVFHDLINLPQDKTSEELHRKIYLNLKKESLRKLTIDKGPEYLKQAVTFTDACSHNYAHWLTEVLPKINLFCNDTRFKNIPIIVNANLHKNIIASLRLIVENRRLIVILPVGRTMNVKELYIMSPTGYVPFERRKKANTDFSQGLFSPFALNQLKRNILKHINTPESVNVSKFSHPKKIFLKRKTSLRKLQNENEIERFLMKNGFAIIEPENLTFTEQVIIFRHAEIVVGVTGAACANIIFSKPSTQFVILMAIHKNMPYRYWLHIANAVGITNVHYVLGEIDKNSSYDFHSDFKIKLQDLKDCFHSLG